MSMTLWNMLGILIMIDYWFMYYDLIINLYLIEFIFYILFLLKISLYNLLQKSDCAFSNLKITWNIAKYHLVLVTSIIWVWIIDCIMLNAGIVRHYNYSNLYSTCNVTNYVNQWYYFVFCFRTVKMDILYYRGDVTPWRTFILWFYWLYWFCLVLILLCNLNVFKGKETDCNYSFTQGESWCTKKSTWRENQLLYLLHFSIYLQLSTALCFLFDLHESTIQLSPVRRL